MVQQAGVFVLHVPAGQARTQIFCGVFHSGPAGTRLPVYLPLGTHLASLSSSSVVGWRLSGLHWYLGMCSRTISTAGSAMKLIVWALV